MKGKFTDLARRLLLRMRVHPFAQPSGTDPYSPHYLYMVQQAKRIALSQTLGRFRLRSLVIWPWLVLVFAARWLDLALVNTLIRSLINEHDLLNRIGPRNGDRCE